ncbi:hypothetical protein AWC32_02045 [Mycobacterium xenopi]|nr:hypothetical protein AWC32_02045 [Mycobacterium xenopi]
MPPLPPAREFLTSAGFGGAAALVAAIVVAVVALLAARGVAKRHRAELEQQQRHHTEIRDDERHAAALTRCWQRLVWVVETAGIEPASEGATLGMGPELALEILRGLLRDAEQLGDDTLTAAVTVHLNQFSLVLAQQSGPLAELAAARPSATDGQSEQRRGGEDGGAHSPNLPDASPAPATKQPAESTPKPAPGGRRRRR